MPAHVERAVVRQPDLQVLIYPLVDMTLESPSIERNAEGYLLTRSMVHWFRGHTCTPTTTAGQSRRSSGPTCAAPPAIVATAGYDPLVDEGDTYAARLAGAGVPVRHALLPLAHPRLVSLAGAVRAARSALDELSRRHLRELLTVKAAARPAARARPRRSGQRLPAHRRPLRAAGG